MVSESESVLLLGPHRRFKWLAGGWRAVSYGLLPGCVEIVKILVLLVEYPRDYDGVSWDQNKQFVGKLLQMFTETVP